MPKFIGEISRERIAFPSETEIVKFPFAASSWMIANDFVEAIAQNMPSDGDRYKYEITATEVDEK